MGTVVEALDLVTDRLRAVKLMRAEIASDDALQQRFRLEATVAGRVESEHVVEVLDAGIDVETGSPYLVTELLRGEDLAAYVRRVGPLPAVDAVHYLTQIALGLDRTHADNIIHRDLKLENLFLTRRDDGSPRIVILDFGIAKVIASTGAQPTRSLGTPLYMAPEQLAGDGAIDTRADLYALGQVTFTMLTGLAYFTPEYEHSDNVFALAARMARGPQEPATVRAGNAGISLPGAFDAWFEKAIAAAVDRRFQSAGEQIDALGVALSISASAVRTIEAEPVAKPASLVATGIATPPLRVVDTSATGVVVSSAAERPRGRSTFLVAFGAALIVALGWLVHRGATASAPVVGETKAATRPFDANGPLLAASANIERSTTVASVDPLKGPPRPEASATPTSSTPTATSAERAGSRPPATAFQRRGAPARPPTAAPSPSAAPTPAPTPAPTYDPLRDF